MTRLQWGRGAVNRRRDPKGSSSGAGSPRTEQDREVGKTDRSVEVEVDRAARALEPPDAEELQGRKKLSADASTR